MRYLRHALVTALLLAFLIVPAAASARHVPYVVGVSGRYAVKVIHRNGWKAYVARRGVYSTRYARYRVVSQATHGGTVTITCSLGRPPTYAWHTAQASFFGGAGEIQSVAGPYPNTGWMNAHGLLYCAHRSLPFRTRVAFRYHGRVVVCVVADRGPARWTHRDWDLGANAARMLGFSAGRIEWAYAK